MSQELLDIGFAHDRTTGKEEWLTPPWILQALGKFDLDPCAPVKRPWEIAKQHFTIHDNGLIRPWHGRVFCNPPYGTQTPRWMQRMSEHTGGGIALIFVRTETATFFPWIWDKAHGFMFIKKRLSFYTTEGNEGGTAGAPSMLISYSAFDSAILKIAAETTIPGKFLLNK